MSEYVFLVQYYLFYYPIFLSLLTCAFLALPSSLLFRSRFSHRNFINTDLVRNRCRYENWLPGRNGIGNV